MTKRLLKHAPSLLPVLETFGKLRRVNGMLPSRDQPAYEQIPLWAALAWLASGFYNPPLVTVSDDSIRINNLQGFCKLAGIRNERLLERIAVFFGDKAVVEASQIEIVDRLSVLEVRMLSGGVEQKFREAVAKEIFLCLNPTEEDTAGFVHPSFADTGSPARSGGRGTRGTRGIARIETVMTQPDQVGEPEDAFHSAQVTESKKDKSARKTSGGVSPAAPGNRTRTSASESVSYVDRVLSDLAAQLARGSGPWIDGVKRLSYDDVEEVDSYVFKRIADLLKNPNISWQLRNRVTSGDVARLRMAYDRESGKTRVLVWQRSAPTATEVSNT